MIFDKVMDKMFNWRHSLDVSDLFHNKSISFEQKRDEIVRRLRQAEWFDQEKGEYDYGLVAGTLVLEDIVDGLAQSDNEEEFDSHWNDLYDWADEDHRLWINVWTKQ